VLEKNGGDQLEGPREKLRMITRINEERNILQTIKTRKAK
jgi:hypothetical protein